MAIPEEDFTSSFTNTQECDNCIDGGKCGNKVSLT